MLSIKNWSIGTRLLLAFILILAPFVGFVSIAGLHFGAISTPIYGSRRTRQSI